MSRILQGSKVRFLLRMFFTLTLLLYAQRQWGQDPLDVIIKEQVDFPHSWVGKWKGELKIYNGEGFRQSVPMQLHILPLDTAGHFSWTLIYGDDLEKGRRPYVLKTLDSDKGRYLIDERNSIALEAYFLHDKLFSRFSVSGSLLLSSTEMRNGQLVFEIISGSLDPASRTGDTTFDGEEMPVVEAFPIVVLQRAVLDRK